MPRKQFSLETKIKYIKLIEKSEIDTALIHFIVEFEDRYESYKKYRGKKKKYRLPTTAGKQRLKNWKYKYNLGGMKSLESKSGKAKKPGNGRPPKTKVSELTKHDQDLYQEVMEEILRDNNIKPSEVMKKIKKKNEEGKKPNSIKDFSSQQKRTELHITINISV